MTTYIDVLKLVARRLESSGVRYMVSGSTAMGFYAQPRMTRDIDVVIDVQPSDAETLVTLFADGYYAEPDAIRTAVRERRLVNVIHLGSMVKLDLIVRRDEPYRRVEFDRRRLQRIDDVDVWMVAPEDLVLSKLLWGKAGSSELQFRDVRNLLASAGSLDEAYLESWADRLGVSDLLRAARP